MNRPLATHFWAIAVCLENKPCSGQSSGQASGSHFKTFNHLTIPAISKSAGKGRWVWSCLHNPKQYLYSQLWTGRDFAPDFQTFPAWEKERRIVKNTNSDPEWPSGQSWISCFISPPTSFFSFSGCKINGRIFSSHISLRTGLFMHHSCCFFVPEVMNWNSLTSFSS